MSATNGGFEKVVWTESDFSEMSWMDAQIWSSYADDVKSEVVLDLDYIVKWEDPKPGEVYFKFWVSPVTMVFENVNGVKVKAESREGAMEVARLHMDESKKTKGLFQFRFECGQGEFCLDATGFKMYLRKKPVLISSQYFSFEERSGISFERRLVD